MIPDVLVGDGVKEVRSPLEEALGERKMELVLLEARIVGRRLGSEENVLLVAHDCIFVVVIAVAWWQRALDRAARARDRIL